jgi:tetratricopeptide (TPR) repeat protein
MDNLRRTVFLALLVTVPVIGQDSAKTKPPKRNWAALHQDGYAAFTHGRYADALADFQTSLPLVSTPRERAMTLSDIGYTLTELGRVAEALAQQQAALALWRSIDPAGRPAQQVAISVGILQHTLGRLREAEQTSRAAVDAIPRDSPDRAVALAALGDLLYEEGLFMESRETFKEALKLLPGRDQIRASALIGLGDAESADRQSRPALAHLREALEISKEIKAPKSEALALRDLANMYLNMADIASAQPLLRRALAILEAVPSMSVQYAGALDSLGILYADENKQALAEDAFTRALQVYEGAPESPRSAVALESMAGIRVRQKRFAEAADFANRAYTVLKSATGENSAPAAAALGTLASVEQEAGDLEQSEHDYSGAIRILRDHGALRSKSASGILSGYARVLRKLHRQPEAKALEQQVKAFRAGRNSQ